MTTSFDHQAGPNAEHSQADRQGRIRLTLHAEKPLPFDLECDIINVEHSSVFCVSPRQALPAVGLHGLAQAGYPPRRYMA